MRGQVTVEQPLPDLTASSPIVTLHRGASTNLPNVFFAGSGVTLTSTISNVGEAGTPGDSVSKIQIQ